MGNSSSQWLQQQQQQQQFQQQSWANSYPRPRGGGGGGGGRPLPLGPGVAKVLPEREPGRRLRLTDNGAILSGGGTISGRREQHLDEHPRLEFRARSTSVHAPPSHLHQQQQHEQQHRPHQQEGRGHGQPQLMRFGSEPDLRMRDAQPSRSTRLNNSRGRKKYKAPAPPAVSPGDAASSSPDSSGRCGWERGEPRRMRLFKTRAETRRSAPQMAQPQSQQQRQSQGHGQQAPHPPLARSLSSPEFQAELVRAAQRLRPLSRQLQRQPPVGQSQSQPQPQATSSPRSQPADNPATANATSGSNGNNNNDTNNNGSAADKHWEILPPPRRRQKEREKAGGQRVPARSFYFGMEHGDRDAVDRFAASLQRRPPLAAASPATRLPRGSLSSGEVSEEEEDEDLSEEPGAGCGGIALQLRPTLPKKQAEVPRFSPTAAWRLLSALEHPASPATSTAGDDASVLLEERIQRLSRPVAPPPPQAPRSKSGDSGISGDASPGREDSLLPAPPPPPPPPAAAPAPQAWTPQQDLGDDSSSDGGGGRPALLPGARFSPRAHHVFSLSLPRDDRLCLALYAPDDDAFLASKVQPAAQAQEAAPAFNSLQKLRRSVSGALGAALGSLGRDLHASASDDEDEPDRAARPRPPLDGNWLLSRSVPTSLNATAGYPKWSRSSPSSGEREAPVPFSYLPSGGHVMYLPDGDGDVEPPLALPLTARSHARQRHGPLWDAAPLSKSCGDISACEMRQVGRTPSPELPPDVRRDREKDRTHRWNWDQVKEKEWCTPREQRASLPQSNQHLSDTDATAKKNKGRRFTFQSTVRQIERRRLAERLSREAELKEKQRLSELEAMRQVEEEFQRKRAREKANIRQQLRLFSLDEQLYSSLPAGWGGTRAEPDGAASPQPSPPPTSSPITGAVTATSTQVLSEYREPRREYRDYRPSSRYNDSSHESLSYMEKKRATVHPQVVCDIPKNTHVYMKPHHQSNGLPAANMYQGEDHGGESTPHSSSSDNYRRELAHGGRPAGYSLASSDSESNMKSPACLINHSRSRSSSPEHSSDILNVEDICANAEKQEVDSILNSVDQEPTSLPPLQVTASRTDNTHRLSFTSLQPFVRNSKGYRPIVFNPGTSTNHKVAQTVN